MVTEENENGFCDVISVDALDAVSVNAKVRLGSGKLAIKGGSAMLCSGRLNYADEMWKPEVTYAVEAGEGTLLISPPQLTGHMLPSPKYNWDVAFTDVLPLALGLQVGSGSTDLQLQDSMLTKLKCEIGSGPISVNILGSMPELANVHLLTGSGQITALLNGDYPKLDAFKVATGSGNVELALGGNFPLLKQVKLATASGSINVGVSGHYDQLEQLKTDTASGDININLTALNHDITIAANSVSGNFVVCYPAGMGVAIKATTLSGKYQADGFSRKQGEYVNAAYGEAAVNVRIKFSSVSGNLTMQPCTG